MNDSIRPWAAFAPDIAALMRPIAGEHAPGGPSLRYAPEYFQIRQARESDDPSLPMGEWERPLKTANWSAVESACIRILTEKSKDFQVAFWLAEAWLHRFGSTGLRAGIAVINLLAQDYWDNAHPLIDEGDADARIAPFAWASEALSLALRVNLPLVAMPDHDPPVGNLDLWERTLGGIPEERKSSQKQGTAAGTVLPKAGRSTMLSHVETTELVRLAVMANDFDELSVDWARLNELLDSRLGHDAPSLSRFTETVESMRRTLAALLDGRDPRVADSLSAGEAVSELELHEQPSASPYIPGGSPSMSAASSEHTPTGSEPGTPIVASLPSGVITSRDEAYKMLEQAAVFLERHEPHSPTPYLVKRAVTWGRMSLTDLMQQILREDGDLTRYFSLLGIDTRSE